MNRTRPRTWRRTDNRTVQNFCARCAHADFLGSVYMVIKTGTSIPNLRWKQWFCRNDMSRCHLTCMLTSVDQTDFSHLLPSCSILSLNSGHPGQEEELTDLLRVKPMNKADRFFYKDNRWDKPDSKPWFSWMGVMTNADNVRDFFCFCVCVSLVGFCFLNNNYLPILCEPTGHKTNFRSCIFSFYGAFSISFFLWHFPSGRFQVKMHCFVLHTNKFFISVLFSSVHYFIIYSLQTAFCFRTFFSSSFFVFLYIFHSSFIFFFLLNIHPSHNTPAFLLYSSDNLHTYTFSEQENFQTLTNAPACSFVSKTNYMLSFYAFLF